ncbi:DNA-binding protein [Paenibacillus selenitireducens]|uniref:DNA-binding protein n=1 Tax=Paenibacillus selenitireducens TaxID=1324314 RepID=A0A1T2X627_9BACL|nr:DNA-binding protein [Paenibacillus selenitireducens]OPA75351.1 DNA-binding protein [Paenibacillus selenitireducens]
MKPLNYSNIISSIILGIAIIIGCLLINSDLQKEKISNSHEIVNHDKPLMTIQETAEYLNITESQVKTIISTEESMLKATGSFTGMMFPIIKIGNEVFVNTNGLNDWLKESTQQRKEY